MFLLGIFACDVKLYIHIQVQDTVYGYIGFNYTSILYRNIHGSHLHRIFSFQRRHRCANLYVTPNTDNSAAEHARNNLRLLKIRSKSSVQHARNQTYTRFLPTAEAIGPLVLPSRSHKMHGCNRGADKRVVSGRQRSERPQYSAVILTSCSSLHVVP
jgi:hypothetical protein